MRDVKGGVDLLALNHGQPWRLRRTGRPQQWPVFFTNGGPGELRLQVQCVGDGVKLGPVEELKIEPGASRYLIVALDAAGSDFARLDVLVDGKPTHERVEVRLYRPR